MEAILLFCLLEFGLYPNVLDRVKKVDEGSPVVAWLVDESESLSEATGM